MFNQIKSFAANESGAVAVDWVVLVAGLIGLAIAAMTAITNTTRDLTPRLTRNLTKYQ
jgi:Flp pilus assembly pilin Flp